MIMAFTREEVSIWINIVPRKGKGLVRGNAFGVPGQHHSQAFQNREVHDNPSANPLDGPGAQMHKMYMNSHREQFQRFRPYYNMDEVEQDTQYDLTDEHRWLIRVPLLIIGSLFTYYFYNRFMNWYNFYDHSLNTKKLKLKEAEVAGMLLIEPGKTKFDQKYLSREEYHRWLDNDIRTFG